MADDKLPSKPASSAREVDAFLTRAAKLPSVAQAKGRLVFAIDATMSRQPTWTKATEIQADMFAVAQSIGGLAVQLVYFRGHGEFHASDWTASAAWASTRQTKVGALVYVGDAFEEDPDAAAAEAGRLALLGVPAFMFHEGDDPHAAAVFRDIARISKGVYARFDSGAAKQLRELLMAAAIYATGGAVALRAHAAKAGGAVLKLADQMGRK